MLTESDRIYFDGKFGEVHEKVNIMNVKLAAHIASPCVDVKTHVDDCHKDKGLKSITIIGSIVAMILAVIAFLKTHIGGH